MTTALQASVEQKFYLRWVNFLLFPSFQISQLSDLKDGYLLVKICEMVLAVDEDESLLNVTQTAMQDTASLSSTKRITKREWAHTNVENAFSYAHRMLANVQDIDGDDILDGKVPAILNFLAAIGQAIYVTGTKFQGVTSDLALLQWMREIAMGMLPAGMTGFTGSWTDGFALSVLSLFPEKEVDERVISSLKKFTALERVTVAMQALSDKGAPLVFDPPDIAMGIFTPRCMRMYVGMVHSLYSQVPLTIIPGVKKELEKLEQWTRYCQQKEEEKLRKKNMGASNGPSSPSSVSGAPITNASLSPKGMPLSPTSGGYAPTPSKLNPQPSALTTPKL